MRVNKPIFALLLLHLLSISGCSSIVPPVDQNGTPRDQVLSQMNIRPNDPWPRGEGHIVLALPGSQEDKKSYFEPGGSFSPSVSSFGVSFWITDTDGKLVTTSDEIPLGEINQQLVWPNLQGDPAILTRSAYYEAKWSTLGSGRWVLEFTPTLFEQLIH